MRNRCTASPHRRPLGIGNRGWCVCWWSDLRVAAGVALNMGGRFFGPATPFAAMVALGAAVIAVTYLWVVGFLVIVAFALVAAACAIAPGKQRQFGVGAVIGCAVCVSGLAVAIATTF